MKFVLSLCCLAVLVAAANSTCNANLQGVPDCTADSGNQKYRNNWDPTAYFVCEDGVAVPMSCNGLGFDASVRECVTWEDWDWYPVC